MWIGNEILQFVKRQLNQEFGAGQNWLDVAPQEATYPFITYSLISTVPTWTFAPFLETCRIQITVFTDSQDSTDLVRLVDRVKQHFHRIERLNPYVNPGTKQMKLICVKKADESIDYLNEAYFHAGRVDFLMTFEKQRGDP